MAPNEMELLLFLIPWWKPANSKHGTASSAVRHGFWGNEIPGSLLDDSNRYRDRDTLEVRMVRFSNLADKKPMAGFDWIPGDHKVSGLPLALVMLVGKTTVRPSQQSHRTRRRVEFHGSFDV